MGQSVKENDSHKNLQIPLVEFLSSGAVFSIDSENWLFMWGPPTEASEDPAHPIMHLMDFYLHEVRSLSFPKWCVAPKSSWVEGLTFKAVKPRAWKEPEPAEFANFFSRIQHDIKLGELQKAVSVVFSSSQGGLCSEEIFNALLRLASSPDDLHVYGFWGEDKAILGASPEILFGGHHNLYETVALAGTAAKKSPVSLLRDVKEMREHEFVKRYISEALENQGLVWGDTHEWEISNLKHLRTLGTFQWSESFLKLVRLLHPTPALGVYPRKWGWQKLKTISTKERGYFGAPIGVEMASWKKCVVAIRNVQWSQEQAWLGSGCGVVEGSQLESEWKELQLKREFTREVLKL